MARTRIDTDQPASTGLTPGYEGEGSSPPGPTGPGRWRRLFGSRRGKVIGAVVIVVLAAGGGIGGWFAASSGSPAAAATTTTRLVAAADTTLRQSISTSGTLEPAHLEDLSFGVSGEVKAVKVAVGQTVKAGQTLATLVSAPLNASVLEAQATLSGDQSTLSSDTDAGASSTQITADQAAVTSAEAQLSSAQQSLADAKLKSPVAGTVATMDLTVGEEVGGGASSGSGASGSGASGDDSDASASSSSSAEIVVIGSGAYDVTTTVTDTEIGEVKTGDQATITPDGFTTPIYGLVSQLGLIATDTDGVASYPVTIAVTGTPSGLYDGATATVSITTEELANVLAVPSTAVHEVDGHSVVYEMSGGKQVAHTVTTGMTSDGETEVTSGLSAGTDVVETIVRIAPSSGAKGASTTRGAGGFTGGGFTGGGAGFTGGGFAGGGGGVTGSGGL